MYDVCNVNLLSTPQPLLAKMLLESSRHLVRQNSVGEEHPLCAFWEDYLCVIRGVEASYVLSGEEFPCVVVRGMLPLFARLVGRNPLCTK
jgi:hypothetical protein